MERKEILTMVLIGVLLITVAIQTIQLVGLKGAQVIVPAASSGTSMSKPLASGGSPSAPSLDLPEMVGGC